MYSFWPDGAPVSSEMFTFKYAITKTHSCNVIMLIDSYWAWETESSFHPNIIGANYKWDVKWKDK